jgi:hypothetical protein
MAEHLGTRFGALDYSRATEQTAIFLSLFSALESGTKYDKTLRARALESMHAYVQHSFSGGKFLFVDDEYRVGAAEKVWPEEDWASFGAIGRRTDPDWRLELVMCPVDGVRALSSHRQNGTVSILAGGPPGSFPGESDLEAGYLVAMWRDPRGADLRSKVLEHSELRPHLAERDEGLFVCHQEWDRRLHDAERALGSANRSLELATSANNKATERDQVEQVVEAVKGAEKQLKEAKAGRDKFEPGAPRTTLLASALRAALQKTIRPGKLLRWTTSTNREDFAEKEISLIFRTRKNSQGHVLEGSSFAAASSVLFPRFGIDLYVGVMRRTQLLLTAVAAAARSAEMICFPVDPGGAEGRNVVLKDDRPVIGVRELVPGLELGLDPFLVATGVSANLILRGTRFQDGSIVATNTMCLRALSKSSRFISHYHDLNTEVFRVAKGSSLIKLLKSSKFYDKSRVFES